MIPSSQSDPQHRVLPSFFARETTEVARSLLGCQLVSNLNGQRTAGLIVETEAYLHKTDSACHANKARTARTEVMFGEAGRAYVYPIHATHCFNVVTEVPERGCAVLIRALEPTQGHDVMSIRRSIKDARRLTTGPGCLCQALAIDRKLNGHDLHHSTQLWIESTGLEQELAGRVKRSPRIGVTSAQAKRLRFYVAGNSFVSGPKKLRN